MSLPTGAPPSTSPEARARLALTIFGTLCFAAGVGLTAWATAFWRPCFADPTGAYQGACWQRAHGSNWWLAPVGLGQAVLTLLALLAGGLAFALGRRWSALGLMVTMLAGTTAVEYVVVSPFVGEREFTGIWMGLLTALGGVFAVAAGRGGRPRALAANSWRWMLRGYAGLGIAAGTGIVIGSVSYWQAYRARTNGVCAPGSGLTVCVRDYPWPLTVVAVVGLALAFFAAGYVLAGRGPVLAAVVVAILALASMGLDRVVTTAIIGGGPWLPVWYGVWTGVVLLASGVAALAFASQPRGGPAPDPVLVTIRP